jgi:hypothetical protein
MILKSRQQYFTPTTIVPRAASQDVAVKLGHPKGTSHGRITLPMLGTNLSPVTSGA